jgi:hypothetical protein
MNTTRFLITSLLAIFFGSLPFAATTQTAMQDARIQLTLSRASANQPQIASAQEGLCPALNLLGCH